MTKNIYRDVATESFQGHGTRRNLFKKIEDRLEGRKLVTFFTSFSHPVMIDNEDCNILQGVLQQLDLSDGLVLMISSGGGDGIAAERIVNTCRAYSGTGDFWVIIPGKAKSAATMISMGASKIYMAPSSELGPVDPQVPRVDGDFVRWGSAYGMVKRYEQLLQEAVNTKGRIEPYLQQLERYDDQDINAYKTYMALADDITVKILKAGVLSKSKKSDEKIREAFKVFLEPDAGTVVHGRPIYQSEAKSCGLKIEELDVKSSHWANIYELYARTERFVSSPSASKAVESASDGFYTGVPRGR
jgi:ATP-dependent protease ClpP protease subunit